MMTRTGRPGFTLIELLVVIGIIALLAAILFPVFGKAREKARQTQCMSNQRQLAQAILIYAQDHDDELPAEGWEQGIAVTGKETFHCPDAKRQRTQTYLLNLAVAGRVLGDIPGDPTRVWLTADGDGGVGGVGAQARRHAGTVVASYLDGHATFGLRTAFDTYGRGRVQHLPLPTVGGDGAVSIFGASYAFFPASAPGNLAGRLLATYGNQLIIQEQPGVGCDPGGWRYDDAIHDAVTGAWRFPQLPPAGRSHFTPVATITASASFLDTPTISISPDGQHVALGIGMDFTTYHVLVFDAAVLTGGGTVELFTDERVWKSPALFGLASLTWVGSDYIAVLRGDFTNSYVEMMPASGGTLTPIMTIPGGSGSITADLQQNLCTGIGYLAGRTGELRVVPQSLWQQVLEGGRGPLDFSTDAVLLATGIGSATSMGIDAEGNVHVSGTESIYGTSYLLRGDVITRMLAGGKPLQKGNALECRTFTPDPAKDDYSMTIVANPSARQLAVVWIPDENYLGEYVLTDTTPIMTLYDAE